MDEDFVAALESRLSAIEGDLVRYRQGTVSDDSPLSVKLGGSDTAISNVSQLASYSPAVDDVVAALAFGNDLLVLGSIGGAGGVPAGAITAFGASTAPTGWLKCDGSSVLRATYPGLFAIIGTTYGAADGTHFNLPNLTGKIPLGYNGAYALASTGGAATHTLAVSEMPSHNHGGSTGTGTTGSTGLTVPLTASHTVNNSSDLGSRGVTDGGTVNESIGSHTHSVPALSISSQGGGGAHNNMPPYLALNFIIKT